MADVALTFRFGFDEIAGFDLGQLARWHRRVRDLVEARK